MKKLSKYHQDFDKLFKENLNRIIFSLTEKVFGLKIDKLEDLNLSMPRTKEKRPDFAKLATNGDEKYIFHLEIQTSNDREMPCRMLEYFEFFYRRHKLPVRQFVLYIGKAKLNMLSEIKVAKLQYEFDIIDIRKIDYEYFINSDKPESIILAILCDYKAQNPRAVISEILHKLENTENEDFQKYVFQLKILSELRSLQEELKNEVKNMPFQFKYDVEKDPFYKEGISQGISQGISKANHETIVRMLQLSFSREQIAEIVNVEVEVVNEVAKTLNRK